MEVSFRFSQSSGLYIPVFKKQMEVHKDYEEIVKGAGTILIIDDEETVRIIAREILEECGYETLHAENGEQGLEVFKLNKDKITAVLLDLVMPRKGGKETYEGLKKIDPKVIVLLTSGYIQDERVEDILELGVHGFIQKPHDVVGLSKAMHNAISSK
jgi:DNA-binding NtrC family response regulator